MRAHAPYERVLASEEMPGARWFPGARLNYAEHLLGTDEDTDRVAVVARSQTRAPIELTFGELREQVARARAGLQRLGVGPGDRVVAYLPNIPETLVAFLATASLGAIWATCAPEFGARSVLGRFGQIEPKLLLAVAGYTYRDKPRRPRGNVAEIRAGLPTLEHVVHVPYGDLEVPDALSWDDLLAQPGELAFEPVAFDHPLYVLFSSGTTGLPKAIVHGHGGQLIEHVKALGMGWDLRPGGRLLWFSTTAWMMWNALVSALLVRSSIVMIDGDPAWPDLAFQWRLAEETRPTFMGVSPTFLMTCRKAGLQPGRDFDLSSIRALGFAGSPLPTEGYHYVYEQLGPDVCLINGSGGTDVCGAFVSGSLAAARLRRRDVRAAASGSTSRRSTRRATRSSASWARWWSPSRCRRCRCASGTTRTARAIARRTSTSTPACGARATGSCSPSAAAASSPAARTPR